ncbi:hypothetical protein [Massilia sp. TSP1-1-2]|uniref:hypothetical protein n=1 Tax=Massilia sp. TSP1-1-2 TaxID=2804649 RepID=UPI003CF04C6C
MAINADSVGTAATPHGARLNRSGAEARQGRWMLELERSMFSAGADAQHGRVAKAGESPAGVADAAPGSAAGRAAENTNEGAKTAPAGGEARHHVTGRTGAPIPLPHAPPLRDVPPALRPTMLLAPSTPAATGQRSAAGPCADYCRPVAPAPLALTGIGAGQPQFPAGALSAESGELAGEQASCAPDAAHFGERPVFEQHIMNLYFRQDGVHAFIRDATLGTAQAQRVARALSTEMDAAGQKMAALTINGHAVLAPGGARQQERQHDTPGEVRDVPTPHSQSRSIDRKGKSQ